MPTNSKKNKKAEKEKMLQAPTKGQITCEIIECKIIEYHLNMHEKLPAGVSLRYDTGVSSHIPTDKKPIHLKFLNCVELRRRDVDVTKPYLCQIKTVTTFLIENPLFFDDFPDSVFMPLEVQTKLANVAAHTVRGLLMSKNFGTPLGDLIMPLQNEQIYGPYADEDGHPIMARTVIGMQPVDPAATIQRMGPQPKKDQEPST